MTTAVLASLLLPLAMPLLASRAPRHLSPTATLWALTATTVVMAGGFLLSLGVLTLAGLLRLRFFAVLGELVRPLHTLPDPLVPAASAGAAALLTAAAWTTVRTALRQLRDVRAARAAVAGHPAAGDLHVIDSPHPDAYALPGGSGRVVVTTAMIRCLDAAERDVLLAHERAHVSGRHHYFLVAADLAASCHPALRTARTAVRLAAERAADEAAATAVGDRRLTARAIARAALAAHDRAGRSAVLPAATAGPVPQRVTALLAGPREGRRGLAVCAALLLAVCAATSAAASATGLAVLHRDVETAQGETGR
ncbi:M48 family metalloprotease [Streptomyces mobaraensis]|uniref:M48 family metalloprotease n=1 Tax=Streptomyces mobaraensis TaxID=35621 RepID=UPI003410CA74